MDATLLSTALLAGCLHTLAGPDHYLPILGLARSREWSLRRSLWVTAGLGLLHCLVSVVLVWGLFRAGVALGEGLVAGMATWAAWLMVAAGVAMLVSSLRALRRRRDEADEAGMGLLALAFLVGPCEWLLPVAMLAGQQAGAASLFGVSAAYTAATLATMLTCVALGQVGLRKVLSASQARPLAGLVTMACGGFMLLGG